MRCPWRMRRPRFIHLRRIQAESLKGRCPAPTVGLGSRHRGRGEFPGESDCSRAKSFCFPSLPGYSVFYPGCCSFVSHSLQPHGLQHTRLPCPSLSSWACLCPVSQWRHPTILSSVVPFSSCLQSFPESGSFLISQLFASYPGFTKPKTCKIKPVNCILKYMTMKTYHWLLFGLWKESMEWVTLKLKLGLCCGSCSVVSDSATPWTVAYQAFLSMGFSRHEYWSG